MATSLLQQRIIRNRAFTVGGGLLMLILLVALLAPWLSPHDPYAQDLVNRTAPPIWMDKGSWLHPLGTDPLGRDYLSRMLYGARISLLIGASVAVISGFIGTTMGLLAGYFGGRTDMVVSFVVTTRLSMPVILVALATVALVGGSLWIVISVHPAAAACATACAHSRLPTPLPMAVGSTKRSSSSQTPSSRTSSR